MRAPRMTLAAFIVSCGVAVLVFGFIGLLFVDPDRTNPPDLTKWLGGGLLAHDALIAPLVGLIGLGLARFAPDSMKAPLQGGLFASGVVILTTFPFWRGYGRSADNPSVLPNDYAAGVAWTLVVIWSAAAVWAFSRRRTHGGPMAEREDLAKMEREEKRR